MTNNNNFNVDLDYYLNATDDLEKKIISAFVNDPETRSEILIKVKADYFNNPILKTLFETIIDFYKKNNEFDSAIFKTYLKTNNHYQQEELMKAFLGIQINYESIENINIYMETLCCYWMEKQSKIMFASWLAENSPANVIPQKMEEHYKTIAEISNARISNSLIMIKELADKFQEKLRIIEENKGKLLGTNTGYVSLNNMLNGFQPGEMIVLAARPSIGKTALALNFLLNAAQDSKEDEAVVMFSLEMSNDVLYQRLLACGTRYNIKKFQSGNFTPQEKIAVFQKQQEISKLNIFLDESPNVNILDIQAKVKQLAKEKKIKLIIVDYLQLIDSATNKNNRAQEVAHVSRTLKLLSLELKIPIIAIAQLSRSIEQRAADDKKPKLSDLRESGAIEQDADVVMFLDYDRTQIDQNKQQEDGTVKFSSEVVVEVTIAKNRNGETGVVKLLFDKATGRYVEVNN